MGRRVRARAVRRIARARLPSAARKLTTRWTENPRLLPFGLRGDAADLPALAGLDARALASFTGACADRELAEERRLAYVAATRAAFWLGCTGYWWGEGVSRLGPSVFLEEVRAACEAGGGTAPAWADAPAEDAENPALAEAGHRARGGRPARGLAARGGAREAGPGDRGHGRREIGPLRKQLIEWNIGLSSSNDSECEHRCKRRQGRVERGGAGRLIGAWERDAGLLLAERAQRRADDAVTVGLPWRLPVSSLVTVAADPAGLAQQVRRPMPRPPAPLARRGTDFHRWVEQRFGPQRLIDPGDLLSAADADAEPDGDQALAEEPGSASKYGEWADRWPFEV